MLSIFKDLFLIYILLGIHKYSVHFSELNFHYMSIYVSLNRDSKSLFLTKHFSKCLNVYSITIK